MSGNERITVRIVINEKTLMHDVIDESGGRTLRSGFLDHEGAQTWANLEKDVPGNGDRWLARHLTLHEVGTHCARLGTPTWSGLLVAGDAQYITARMERLRAALTHDVLPPMTGEKYILVTNKDGTRRGIKPPSMRALQKASDTGIAPCSGPCKCRVEPDGHCPRGWPSIMMAAGII